MSATTSTSISEDEKFETMVIREWEKRFNDSRMIRKNKHDFSLYDDCEGFTNCLRELKQEGYNVYLISVLLKALVQEDRGYKYFKEEVVDKYEAMIETLNVCTRLPGLQYCVDVLKRHKRHYSNYLEHWNLKSKPSKKGSSYIRSSIMHLLTKEGAPKKIEGPYNKTKAASKVAELMGYLGLGKVPSEGTLMGEYRQWKRDDCFPPCTSQQSKT